MAGLGDDLTTIELLVLWEAGGDNTLGTAYGCVQLYAEFQREEEMLDVTQHALLRLFDLGLIRCVEAPTDVGDTAKRFELPAMTRDDLMSVLRAQRNGTVWGRDTNVWYDPTPKGESVLVGVDVERIPRVSGTVSRPWLKPGERPRF